jgi:hypothetical protein
VGANASRCEHDAHGVTVSSTEQELASSLQGLLETCPTIVLYLHTARVVDDENHGHGSAVIARQGQA